MPKTSTAELKELTEGAVRAIKGELQQGREDTPF
jgi:hypothetical protein